MRALEIGDFKEDVGAALARASSGEAMADLDAYQMPSKNLPDGRGVVGKLQD